MYVLWWLLLSGLVTALCFLAAMYRMQSLAAMALADPTNDNVETFKAAGASAGRLVMDRRFLDATVSAAKEHRQLGDAARNAARQNLQTSLQSAELWPHRPDIQRRYLMAARDAARSLGQDVRPIEETLSKVLMQKPLTGSHTIRSLAAKRTGPAIDVDVQIVDSRGANVTGLTAADIAVRDDEDRVIEQFAVIPDRASAEQSVCILLDCSASMQGLKMAEQILAVRKFISQCGPDTRIKLVAFDATVRALTPFTNDHTLLTEAIQGLQASGSTLLISAVEAAAVELAPRTGARSIVVCTDGHEANKEADVDRAIAMCKARQIPIYVLGADEPQLNRALLTRLTSETGGQVFLASAPSELSQKFASLHERLSVPIYRITVLDPSKRLNRLSIQLTSLPNVRTVAVIDGGAGQ